MSKQFDACLSMFSLNHTFTERAHGDFRVDGASGQPEPVRPTATTPADSAPMKRLSLQLSATLHREAKLAALEDDETLNSMVVGLLRNYLRDRRTSLQPRSQQRG
ncbi:MAG: hypothetical protein QM522_11935 [Chitinophagaceae bacterium]|nr:hypothetical protein [Chitinophagaceae bacterium]